SRRRSPPTPSTSKSAVPESRRLLPPVLATRRPAPARSPPTGPPRPQRRPSLPRPPASRARPAASTTAAAWACSFLREDDPHEALYGRRGVAVERDGDALKLARAQHERLGRVVAGDAIAVVEVDPLDGRRRVRRAGGAGRTEIVFDRVEQRPFRSRGRR